MSAQRDVHNLALRPGVTISTSAAHLTGGGSRDPQVLLNETAHRLHGLSLAEFDRNRGFDTYDGQNAANGPDWYQIAFPVPLRFNCVEMTTGWPYRDGGWWRSLTIETRTDQGAWQPVGGLTIAPPYEFADTRGERRPHETFLLTFDPIVTTALRLIGQPGGIAQFTSLSRLAVYHRATAQYQRVTLPAPVPKIFRLIPPHAIWDLSESLTQLSGLTAGIPLLEYYLDEARFLKSWQRIACNYQGEPSLVFLAGESLGWDQMSIALAEADPSTVAPAPFLQLTFHNTLATAVAPIVVDDELIGYIHTDPVIVKDSFEWKWHRRYAYEHEIAWSRYANAIARSPQMTREQLQGAAGLIGLMANTIANLAHHNAMLQRELEGSRRASTRRSERHELVRAAITYMREQVEAPIDVAAIAKEFGLGPAYFSTVFREEAGRTPIEYLVELRLERAKDYLLHSDISVLEISIALGYSPSYFSRLFKRTFGCTPGHFRTIHQH